RLYTPLYHLNPPPTPHLHTLSLHDALPICPLFHHQPDRWRETQAGRNDAEGNSVRRRQGHQGSRGFDRWRKDLDTGKTRQGPRKDRKSTRLNSSHRTISYAVFCLKKKIKS